VFSILLSEYDIKWDGKQLEQHPASFEIEGQFLPNLQQKICVRKRRSGVQVISETD
jgi:hypothetical protein